jgi:AmmeMemoRadiSam system protein A
MLTEAQKRSLLQIARRSLEESVRGKPLPISDVGDPVLNSPGAAFVTLKKAGQLRGCIGMMEAVQPLCLIVSKMARAAALEDPRFHPVAEAELAEIEVEISVLGALEPVRDVGEIEVGKHGLRVQRGLYSGVLLPQVPTSLGWERIEFLRQTCHKAGLPYDAWEKGAEIYKFTAEVFGEGD